VSGLVFVHGIGGIRKDDEELARWLDALLIGARSAGHTGWADAVASGSGPPIRFANYSDLFWTKGGQGGAPGELDPMETEILAQLLLESIDTQLDVELEEESTRRGLVEARAQLQPAGQAQGALDLFRRVVNAATALVSIPPIGAAGQWLTATVMVGELAQVARYLARSEIDGMGATLDRRIRSRVAAAFPDEPSVVVGHSLGSVVSLETLHESSGDTPLFVTIGSPIALRAAVLPRLLPTPACTPESVGRWLNFWDRDDIIAARPILEQAVRANAAGTTPESHRVDSDGIWAHTATKYLRQPAVAGPIAEQLSAAGVC
jgi:hypothetical protein